VKDRDKESAITDNNKDPSFTDSVFKNKYKVSIYKDKNKDPSFKTKDKESILMGRGLVLTSLTIDSYPCVHVAKKTVVRRRLSSLFAAKKKATRREN